MAIHAIRSVFGNVPAPRKATSAAAIVKGCLVNINTDGLLEANTTSDANPEKTVGVAISPATAASQEVDYIPLYPGIQFKCDFSGTFATTDHRGKNFGVTITSGVPTVDLTDTTNDTVKFIELDGTTTVNGKAWFELAYLASQNTIEVA